MKMYLHGLKQRLSEEVDMLLVLAVWSGAAEASLLPASHPRSWL